MSRRTTLAGRLGLSVLGVGLLGLLLQALLLQLWLPPRQDRALDALLPQLALAQKAIAALPAAARPALAARLSDERLQLALALASASALPPPDWPDVPAWDADPQPGPESPGRPPPPPPPLPPVELSPAQRALLAPGSRLHWLPAGDASASRLHLQMRWPLDGERWQLHLSGNAMPPPPGLGPFQLGLLLTALLAGGALWLAVRSVTRPIERLAAQIAEQGQELRPLVLRDDAGAEVAALVQAFNEAVGAVDLAQRQRQQLLAGLSHDLRTPLARLRMRVETQLQDHVPAPLQSALERDLQALQHMIDQFLHFVQGETAPRPGPPRALGLLLAEVLALFPDVHTAGTLPAALLERPLPETALRRLLVNLIDNAMAHGQAPLRLELGLEGERVRIAVADAGVGLDEASFAQALQPFVRLAERPGSDSHGGHCGHCGLGLPIAAQMARQLGAELRCRPRNGDRAFAVELLLPAR